MAGTINTTNYGFKKYAPEDTVSMLQTFNGNMDGIDAAIKARQNENTVTAANVQKVEQGLAVVNEAINTTNNTVAAQNVQIQTNKQNITSQGVEIDSLDNRVTALEDGGSIIEKITLALTSSVLGAYSALFKQGNLLTGSIYCYYKANANSVLTGKTFKSFSGTVPSPLNYCEIFNLTGNPFGLDPNEYDTIGSAFCYRNESPTTNVLPLVASYNGTTTTIYAPLISTAETHYVMATIDYLS